MAKENIRNMDLTELVFVLDRSGSMQGSEDGVIGGFNELLKRQKALPGRAVVSVALFDDRFEVLHDREEISRVGELTEREYWVRGCTALLDAVGRTIRHVSRAQREAGPEDRPGKTLFVINTDGLENASREYSRDQIQSMVREEQDKYGWEFLFLGANIDSYGEARRMGIRADRTCNITSDALGWLAQFASVSDAASSLRSHGFVGESWRRRVDEDYEARGKK